MITFFWKCGVRQCGLGKVSTGHKKNLSHFYISKKFWKPCQTFGRLVLAVWSRADWLVFFKVSRTFLKYENGSKNFYELLRSILTYTELPHIFEKKVIMLAGMYFQTWSDKSDAPLSQKFYSLLKQFQFYAIYYFSLHITRLWSDKHVTILLKLGREFSFFMHCLFL